MKKKSAKKSKVATHAKQAAQEKRNKKNRAVKITAICLACVVFLAAALVVAEKIFLSTLDMAVVLLKQGGDDLQPDGMYVYDNKSDSAFELSLSNGCGFDIVTNVVARSIDEIYCTAVMSDKPVLMKVNGSDVDGSVDLPGTLSCMGMFDDGAVFTVSDSDKAGKLLIADFENGTYSELFGNVAETQSGKQFVSYGNAVVYKDSLGSAYMYYSEGKASEIRIPEKLSSAQLCALFEDEAIFESNNNIYSVNVKTGKSAKIINVRGEFENFCCFDYSGRCAIVTSNDSANELSRAYIYDIKTGVSVEMGALAKYSPSTVAWLETEEGLLSLIGLDS